MKKKISCVNFLLSSMIALFFAVTHAHAGSFGFGVHGGYGVTEYKEFTTEVGSEIESESTLDTLLLGFSAEYGFAKPQNFFAAVVTDWAIGLEDKEKWKENGALMQKNNISLFGQFYDFRFGYKNSLERLYYRTYLSGGWDGIYFRRKDFIVNGVPQSSGVITEDFSLWRIGAGFGLGYKFGKWALDGRMAYSYYFDGEVRNSSDGGLVFDTNGTCLDMGLGIARQITNDIGFYVGGSFTQIDLDESEIIDNHVFPDSRTRILAGVANFTYAF